MSFVDLMADDDWSEADIVNRMESMIRASYPATEESIINRKITGSGLGFYTLIADEQAEIADYAQVCAAAQQAGRDARSDMALLRRVLAAERGETPLADNDTAGQELLAARLTNTNT